MTPECGLFRNRGCSGTPPFNLFLDHVGSELQELVGRLFVPLPGRGIFGQILELLSRRHAVLLLEHPLSNFAQRRHGDVAAVQGRLSFATMDTGGYMGRCRFPGVKKRGKDVIHSAMMPGWRLHCALCTHCLFRPSTLCKPENRPVTGLRPTRNQGHDEVVVACKDHCISSLSLLNLGNEPLDCFSLLGHCPFLNRSRLPDQPQSSSKKTRPKCQGIDDRYR